jgi:endonuclease/exonuclease/phosphatase family metal-dependent hydrolase
MVTVLGWTAAGLCLLFAVLRIAAVDRIVPLAQFMAFTPYVVPVAALVTAVTFALGLAGPGVVAAVATVALAAVIVPRIVPRIVKHAPDVEGCPLRVLSANLLGGRADPAALVTIVREQRVDILAVQELTTAAVERLDEAGIGDVLPHRALHPATRYHGSGIFSRYPLSDGSVRVHPCAMRQSSATVAVPEAGRLRVESAHPSAPNWHNTACWRHDLRTQPEAGDGGPPVILLGDFNATLDHSLLRRVIAAGYRDAGATTGRGLRPTWPFAINHYPPVTLDHVLVDRRLGITQYAVMKVAGSDHRAVLTEVTVPQLARVP